MAADTRTHEIPTALGRLHVEVTGTGPAVVFWPSLLMDGTLWAAQVEHLAPSRTTVVVDPPGHGRSEAIGRTFTLDECARAIVAILDHLGLDRVDVVGNSWGAMTGATLAATHPERVRRAVLMNGTASAAPRRQRFEYGALLAATRVVGGVRGPLVRPVLDAFLGPTSRRDRPEVVARVAQVARANRVSSVIRCVRSVVSLRPDQRARFASIEAPVLVVAGREDATFPVDEVRAMAAAIPGATFTVIEDAAHLVALEVPDAVNALIDDFLATPDR